MLVTKELSHPTHECVCMCVSLCVFAYSSLCVDMLATFIVVIPLLHALRTCYVHVSLYSSSKKENFFYYYIEALFFEQQYRVFNKGKNKKSTTYWQQQNNNNRNKTVLWNNLLNAHCLPYASLWWSLNSEFNNRSLSSSQNDVYLGSL